MKDQRRESRRPADGEVQLWSDSEPLRISARLLDISRQGFRAAHSYAAIAAGQELSYCHPLSAGRARVVWSRVLNGRVESGFFVLPG